MINIASIPPSIELQLSKHPSEEFGVDFLQQVVDGISQEDMRRVSLKELVQSYAATAAIDYREAAKPQLAGFIRQVRRHTLTTRAGELCVAELGSAWVNPIYRGQGLGRALIKETTQFMRLIGFVPIAVCNEIGRKNFETAGFTPIGTIPAANQENTRTLEVYESHSDWLVRREWPQGLRTEVFTALRELPRFAEMTLTI